MTLEDLLYGIENQKYRQEHTYNLPKKLFKRYLRSIVSVDYKCKTFIKLNLGYKPKSEIDFSLEVEDKGYWVVEYQENVVVLFNYVLKRQAEQAIKNKNGFIVEYSVPSGMTHKEYTKLLRKQSILVKQDYLMTYQDDELIRAKDIWVILNDILRGNQESSKKTFLYMNQPETYEKVVLIINKLRNQGAFKRLEKYLEGGYK